jgi:hypothetical protein
MYMLERTTVNATPLARMCSSVWKWSRAKVKVQSGAAARKET